VNRLDVDVMAPREGDPADVVARQYPIDLLSIEGAKAR
jgi:hypothetical protein